ncbi:hypothetical protein BSZ07_00370 [Streptomyces sp. M1013]|nr:hypothetical protein BSZ07_00370 [Streptomyces sp. M1013]
MLYLRTLLPSLRGGLVLHFAVLCLVRPGPDLWRWRVWVVRRLRCLQQFAVGDAVQQVPAAVSDHCVA